VPGGPDGRFIGHEAGRGRDDQAEDRLERDPLIGAAGAGRGGGQGPGDAARAAGARATSGSRPVGPVLSRTLREGRGQAAGDQVIQPVVGEQPLGPRRGDVVVAAGPGRSRRSEALNQEQQERPRAPSRQSPEPIRPHHTPAIEPDPSMDLATCLENGYRQNGTHAQDSLHNAPIIYPTGTWHCKPRFKIHGRKPATSTPGRSPPPVILGRLHPAGDRAPSDSPLGDASILPPSYALRSDDTETIESGNWSRVDGDRHADSRGPARLLPGRENNGPFPH